MFVELLIPDNIAITTRKVLERMGYSLDVRRADYYKFKTKKDVSAELGKVDILVNANKNKFTNSIVSKTNPPQNPKYFKKITLSAIVWPNQDIEVAKIDFAINKVLISVHSYLL